MIKECELWLGKYPNLFKRETNEWIEDVSVQFDLKPHDIVRLTVTSDTDIDEWVNNALNNDEALFSPRRIVVLKNIDKLKSDQINKLIKHLEDGDADTHLLITQAGGKILKKVNETLTKDFHDFSVPDKVRDAVTWGAKWLKTYKTDVSSDALSRLFEYAGEDRAQYASALYTLSQSGSDHKLEWEDVSKQCGNIGAVSVFEVTNAISRGDTEAAVSAVKRMGKTHPLVLVKMLSNRYRGYLALLSDAPDVGTTFSLTTSPYALKMMNSECQKLGQSRVTKSFNLIAETERGMKGGDSLKAEDSIMILVIRLSQIAARK